MLADSDYPVGMIALSVGYEDAMYFSRLFKSRKRRVAVEVQENSLKI